MPRIPFRSISRLPLALGLLVLFVVVLVHPAAAQVHPNHAQGFEPQRAFEIGGLENVDLFNGNLNLSIPIGGTYPVGGEFSYGLTLSYTGNVWEWEEDYEYDPNNQVYETFLLAIPRKRSNAGLGWQLSLGRLNPPESLLTNSGSWTYESPDGGIHVFGPNLHDDGSQTPGYLYTQDGTYLRLNTTTRTLEFPDGTIQRFDTSDRLVRMEDRYGNGFNVTYGSNPVRWIIVDDQARTQTVYFKNAVYYGPGSVVDHVDLEAFGGATATYSFHYAEPSTGIARGYTNVYAIGQGLAEPRVMVPLLTGITLPDGSSYSMPVSSYDLGPASPGTSSLSGHLLGMTLPTGGKLEWQWTEYNFPKASARRSPLDMNNLDLGSNNNPFRKSVGLTLRRHVTPSGGLSWQWSYDQELDLETDLREKQSRTIVVDPLRHPSIYYFSVFDNDMDPATPEPAGYYSEEYGLPFSRKTSDGTSPGRYISAQISDSSGSLLRTVYVRYERDGLTDANPRLASQRTVFHDDSGRHLDVTSSSFDGVGHYRTVSTTGDLGGSDRTVFTNYNPGWCAACQPSTGTAWILDTYTETQVTEGTATAKAEYCWDKGLLTRKRVLKSGATQDSADVASVFVRDTATGNVTSEEVFGGDLQSLSTGNLCNLSLPLPVYQTDHTYSHGSLATSQITGTTFLSVDRDIDTSTGLVKVSRDSTSLATTYTYDAMGRLTLADVASGEGADTSYTYSTFSASQPAQVTIKELDGTTVLTQQQIQFDGFGRVNLERRLMPDGSWAERSTKTDALGNVYRVSEWEADGDPDPSYTAFGKFDPFGRPGKVTLPDGHLIEMAYNGIGRKTTKVPVGTTVAADGSVDETSANTTEFYDRYGRLVNVLEPGYPGNAAQTKYEYDVLGNLKRVEMNSDGTPTQVRTFTYDGRGFLASETHPELGTTIYYSDYDALGNPGRTQRGGWDLRSTYDVAGRLVKIREQTKGRDWKEWNYSVANGTDPVDGSLDRSKGKLRSMIRHNWVLSPGATSGRHDYPVTETYIYSGVGGRISRVATDVANVFGPPHFDYSLSYDALGEVTSRVYPQCSYTYCGEASSVRTVTQAFTRGLLTGVPGYASTISYHPNGLVAKVQHSNGVSWIQENDPSDMLRPARIRTQGASDEMDTGYFQYDGAGNIVAIGPERYVYDVQSRIKKADLEVTSLLCDDLALHGTVESGTAVREACRNVTADGGYTVTSSGNVTLRAGGKIVLDGPVSVQAGGYLKAEVDPTLADGQEGTRTKSQTYSYDLFGNLGSITTSVDGGIAVPRTFGIDATTNRLTVASYDTSGNVTSWAGNGFGYDPFNMLREGPGHVYFYGPGDERLWDIDYSGTPRVETWTLRDLDGTPLRQFRDVGGNSSGNWTLDRDYIWGGSTLLAAQTPSGLQHFFANHLGSPQLITGSGATVVATHRYYPFGEEATDPNQDQERLKFTGHERDFLASGTTDDLDYQHARYFSPHLGRFMSVDPGDRSKPNWPQSWNRYSYTFGNPLRYVDPDGEWPSPATTMKMALIVANTWDEIKRGSSVQVQAPVLGGKELQKLGLVKGVGIKGFEWFSVDLGPALSGKNEIPIDLYYGGLGLSTTIEMHDGVIIPSGAHDTSINFLGYQKGFGDTHDKFSVGVSYFAGVTYTLDMENLQVDVFNYAFNYDETAMLLETLDKKGELPPGFHVINGAVVRVYEAK